MKKQIDANFEKEWAKDNRGLPLPYRQMDGDFQSSYFFSLIVEFRRTLKARAPLTLSIGLLCSIEQAGREVLRYRNPDRDHFGNRECFDEFLQTYMGYRKVASNRYDIFRNGIVHSGLPKSEKGSGIALNTGEYFSSRKMLMKVRGIHIHRNQECQVTLSVLLNEFESGVRKLRWHEIRYGWKAAKLSLWE